MSTQNIVFKTPGMIVLLLLATSSFAQYTTPDEAKDFINDHLSHSFVQKIDADGTVTMNAPDEKIKFNLREVSINYNGANNDDRVRIACDGCIEHYEHKIMVEKTNRQSFLCESEKDAFLVIDAFKFLKKKYASNKPNPLAGNKMLKVADSTFNTKTVAEAIDFINENLSYSMITGIDDAGSMTINAPEEIYQVNLMKAEFGYNDDSDGSKVRIYGDFCIGMKENDGDKELLTRKSFQTRSRVKAYKVITVLYYLKCTYANLDPEKIPGLKNLGAVHVASYSNISEAIEFINSRLSYSIILGIDPTGNVAINAPEEIYRFNLKDVKISSAQNHKSQSEWFPFVTTGNSSPGVLLEGASSITKLEAPDSAEKLDEQVFQCGSMSEMRDVVKAFTYIKNGIKK